MEITKEVWDNLKQMKYETYKITDGELYDMVPSLGYVCLGYGTTYKDGTKGVLMALSPDDNKYNNGVYMLHKMSGGEIVMEVIKPNTNDKGSLITHVIDSITNHIDGLDTSDMGVYDFTEAFGFVIANSVVKPLAKSLFPNDMSKQERFTLLYLPRFLANVAYVYSGDKNIREEGVNSEPYVLKMMIDNETKKSAEEKANNESKNESKNKSKHKSENHNETV